MSRYVVSCSLVIPTLDPTTGYLPSGDHEATLAEVREKFAYNVGRMNLFQGLQEVAQQLWAAGVDEIFIDGSYCTEKPIPNDIDGYWVYKKGIDTSKIAPCLLYPDRPARDPATGQVVREMRLRYGVEFFAHPLHPATVGGTTYPVFFRTNRDGTPRGIIKLRRG